MTLSSTLETGEPRGPAVVVVGAGRWARVLTEVLCGLRPQPARVCVYSAGHADVMTAWLKAQSFADRVTVSSAWPQPAERTTNAAIVVNAARDHEAAVEQALRRQIPVLVEKPKTASLPPRARGTHPASHLLSKLRLRGITNTLNLFPPSCKSGRYLLLKNGLAFSY